MEKNRRPEHYDYDGIRRSQSVCKRYSDGTVGVDYLYDQTTSWSNNLTNTIGRLTKTSRTTTGWTAQSVFSYDATGRIVNQWQCTPVNCGITKFTLTYAYDLAGDLITSTDGMGTTFTSAYDQAARLTTYSSSLVDTNHPATLLAISQYSPFGIGTMSTFGNQVSEVRDFDNQGRPKSLTDTGAPLTTVIPATSGHGTVTVNGSPKTFTVPAAPGHGTVTIGGAERLGGPPSVCPTGPCIPDQGLVTVTVNGFSPSVEYFSGSNQASVAASVAAAFNVAASPVTATSSGNVVTFTSKVGGVASNYSLTATSSTENPQFFTGPSFFASASGPTLTGGTNSQTLLDSGTVSITVNGVIKSVAYSNTSTGIAWP